MLKVTSLRSVPAVLLFSIIWIAPAFADPSVDVFDNTITLEEVQNAQRGWCKGLLAINDAYQKGGHKAAKAKAITISKTFFSHTIDINYGTSMLGKAKGAESIRTEHERRKARKESSGEQTATNYVIQESFDDDDIRLGESASTHGENDSELYSRDVVTLEPPRQ